MHIFKFQWKHWLLLCTALLMTATLVAGCAAEEAEEEKPTITFFDGSWESMWIENAIAQFIIEEGYGYPTETVVVDTAVYQVSAARGDIHIDIEFWPANQLEWYNAEMAAGTIEELAVMLEGGPQFWIIPQWVHEEYNINTVFDMKEHWELFKDPEDPTKGRFINSILGWPSSEVGELKIEAYGLADYYNIITPGSAGALDAALAGPQIKHEPVFGFYWSPTALMGMYDWYILEEPEYDPDIWAKITAVWEDASLRPLDEACAWQSMPCPIIVWSGLRDIAPDVVAILEKMTIGLDRINKTAAWSVTNEVTDYEKAAVWFLREYESRWKTWVTDDAYNKIKKALDEYGPVP